MSQNQHFIKHLIIKNVCKNLKEQEFVKFCKENIFEKKDEKKFPKCSYIKGIVIFFLVQIKKKQKTFNV